MSLKAKTAFLSSDKNYTSFKFGDKIIRFKTSSRLEKYTKVISWDDGYIVVLAKYNDLGETEEYIDLKPILKNLYIDETFLNKISQVEIKYD